MTAHDIIIRPVLTESSYEQMADKKYTFIVDPRANKYQIRQAVEEIFGVQVEKVNTAYRKGHLKRMGRNQGLTSSTKRAIVKLKASSRGIEFFEGMAQAADE